MTITEQLITELDHLAPDWEWSCVEKRSESPVLIAPVKIEIGATNRHSGIKTIPIEVSCLKHANIAETARFVCQILMIETPGGSRAKLLLVQS